MLLIVLTRRGGLGRLGRELVSLVVVVGVQLVLLRCGTFQRQQHRRSGLLIVIGHRLSCLLLIHLLLGRRLRLRPRWHRQALVLLF
jgi:hypothetical protein